MGTKEKFKKLTHGQSLALLTIIVMYLLDTWGPAICTAIERWVGGWVGGGMRLDGLVGWGEDGGRGVYSFLYIYFSSRGSFFTFEH